MERDIRLSASDWLGRPIEENKNYIKDMQNYILDDPDHVRKYFFEQFADDELKEILTDFFGADEVAGYEIIEGENP